MISLREINRYHHPILHWSAYPPLLVPAPLYASSYGCNIVSCRPFQTVSGSQALPQRDPPRQQQHQRRPQAPPTNHTPNTSKGELAKKGPANINSREAPDTWQIFVGGLPHNVTQDDIREVFSSYDISEVRVNPKNFAFVVFNGSDPVEKIMAEKDSFQLKGKTLNIENKRSSAGRGGQGGFSRKPFGGGGGMGGKMRSGAGGGGGGSGGGKGLKR